MIRSKAHFSGTYHPEDVTILLKPTAINTTDVVEKEALIQSGTKHYSEMLSPEKVPDERYMQLYQKALLRNGARLRRDIETLALEIAKRPATSRQCVIASLARAGTPIGVLLKRALSRLGIDTHHYSISIIRGRGIDRNALEYIADRHVTSTMVFVDGWTGKGAIKGELQRSLADHPLGFQPFLAVVADPAGRADLAATSEDYVIPSGLLNGIVSGLISRSVLNGDLVGPTDFHACMFQEEHREHDLSQSFIDAIERMPRIQGRTSWTRDSAYSSQDQCSTLIDELSALEDVDDVNRIKPGIAESTRAILRRVPHAIYVKDRTDPEVQHILHLARQLGLDVKERNLHNYRAVTVIKKIAGAQE